MPKTSVPLLTRLLKKTARAENGCLLWTGSMHSKNGVGVVRMDGRLHQAHRLIYEILKGPIPEGLVIDHICHNRDLSCDGGPKCPHRRCMDVEHMEPTTNVINIKRGRAGINSRKKTHCPQGHPYSEENTYRYAKGNRRFCRICVKANQDAVMESRREYFRQKAREYAAKKRAAQLPSTTTR